MEEVDTAADLFDCLEIMGDQDDGFSFRLETVDFLQAFLLEILIPHSQDLVHKQDIRVDVDGDRKTQPDIHPG